MASKAQSTQFATKGDLDRVLTLLGRLETSLAANNLDHLPSPADLRRDAEKVAGERVKKVEAEVAALVPAVQKLSGAIGLLLKNAKGADSAFVKRFNREFQFQIEPLLDEFLRLEDDLKERIEGGTARASKDALAARNAASGAALAAELAIKTTVNNFAYGSD